MTISRISFMATCCCIPLIGSTMVLASQASNGETPSPAQERSVLVAPGSDGDDFADKSSPVTEPPLVLVAPRSIWKPPVAAQPSLEELPPPIPRDVAPPPTRVAPHFPPPVAPAPPAPAQLGARPGMLVPGAPVYPLVRVKDHHKVAPGARPAVVAVRDPSACKHDCACCVHRTVFVEVWLPPYPPKELKVEDNGREIELDYGEYEVEIEVKKRGVIVVDYDD